MKVFFCLILGVGCNYLQVQEVRCLVTEQVGLAAHYSLKAHDGEALLFDIAFSKSKIREKGPKKKKKKESSAKIVARYCCQFYQIESEISAIVTVAALNKHLEKKDKLQDGPEKQTYKITFRL